MIGKKESSNEELQMDYSSGLSVALSFDRIPLHTKKTGYTRNGSKHSCRAANFA